MFQILWYKLLFDWFVYVLDNMRPRITKKIWEKKKSNPNIETANFFYITFKFIFFSLTFRFVVLAFKYELKGQEELQWQTNTWILKREQKKNWFGFSFKINWIREYRNIIFLFLQKKLQNSNFFNYIN